VPAFQITFTEEGELKMRATIHRCINSFFILAIGLAICVVLINHRQDIQKLEQRIELLEKQDGEMQSETLL